MGSRDGLSIHVFDGTQMELPFQFSNTESDDFSSSIPENKKLKAI